ncbi:hypothetical protein VPNG_05760 [Cytospora leucostoma]|uniref:Uncharacterized protein n=1 Tax=Cytospora leucostoma TaxID=1230097 RepID=A0A423X058_9PEZI|nr:hypothetical protein VPNG_05760 [Cytospora leucostoma]
MSSGIIVLGSRTMPFHGIPGPISSLVPLSFLDEVGRILSIIRIRPRSGSGSSGGIGSRMV